LKVSIIKRIEKLEEQLQPSYREPEIDWERLTEEENKLLIAVARIYIKYRVDFEPEPDLSKASEEERRKIAEAARVFEKHRKGDHE